jgi:hypothetical protein
MDISMVIQLSHIGVLVPDFSSPKALVGRGLLGLQFQSSIGSHEEFYGSVKIDKL